MNCSNCGAAVPSGAMFCTNCGANMAQAAPAQHPRVPYPGKGGTRCSNCGGTVPDGYSFCPGCGMQVGGMRAAVPSSVCWSCSAAVPGDMRFCPSCGADQDDIPMRRGGGAPISRSSGSGNGALIALIGVLVAIIASLSIAFATGALDGLFKSDDDDEPETAAATPAVVVVTPDAQAATPAPAAPEVPAASSDYILPDSGSRYLTNADLVNLSWRDLCLARNEIFARHGRIFKTPEIAAYFNSKSWYSGRYSEVTLSAMETANVNLILAYEKANYGRSYY